MFSPRLPRCRRFFLKKERRQNPPAVFPSPALSCCLSRQRTWRRHHKKCNLGDGWALLGSCNILMKILSGAGCPTVPNRVGAPCCGGPAWKAGGVFRTGAKPFPPVRRGGAGLCWPGALARFRGDNTDLRCREPSPGAARAVGVCGKPAFPDAANLPLSSFAALARLILPEDRSILFQRCQGGIIPFHELRKVVPVTSTQTQPSINDNLLKSKYQYPS